MNIRLLSDTRSSMNTISSTEINSPINRLSTNRISNDWEYKLCKYINDNDILSIIEFCKKTRINFSLKDTENNTFLMMIIKKIKPLRHMSFHLTCPIIKITCYDIKDIYPLFLNKKNNINCRNKFGETALILAIKNLLDADTNDNTIYDLVDALIKSYPNINVNVQDDVGYTALMHSIKLISKTNEKQANAIIKLLLQNNADSNILGDDGKNALMLVLNNETGPLELVQIFVDKYSNNLIDDLNLLDNGIMLFRLGNFYGRFGKIDEMKKCYIMAVMLKNNNAKMPLYNYYRNANHDLITKDEYDFIIKTFKYEGAFAMVYKSKYFHESGECPICLEDVNNIVKLPCHITHTICVKCVNLLKKNTCPFCRATFFV
jgi:ankyrin repeat protein